MKIVYSYIANFPPFKKSEMNFVSDYRCNLNGETLIIRYSEVLPKGFYSPDEKLCVSAVVGPNGSGKTSFVRFLASLMYPVQKQDFVLVLEAKGDIIVYYNLNGGNIKVEGVGCVVKAVMNRYEVNDFMHDISNCFNVVYYSPHYSLSTPFRFSNDGFVNLSTTYLLNNAMDGVPRQNRSVSSSVFIAEEFYRLARFYEARKATIPDVSGEAPNGIVFVPDTQTLSLIYSHYADALNKEKIRIEETRKGIAVWERTLTDTEMSRINAMVSFFEFDFQDAFMSVFQCFVALIWQKKIYKDKLFQERGYGCLLYDFCVSLIDSNRKDKRAIRRKVINFLKLNKPEQIGQLECLNEKAIQIKSKNPLLDFFEILSGLASRESGVGEIYLQMPWNILLGKLEFVKELYRHTTAIGPFVELRFDPPMSSGQYNLHSFYARLYEYFTDIRETVAGYNGSDFSREFALHMESGWVVILDEVEVTLHPEWQRTIVSDVLSVFKEFFKGFNVHFIFTTHSPMILSDIPKGNVVFLDKMHSVIDGNRGTNTFGANIFDLLRQSFSMGSGALGKFAYDKIQHLLTKVADIDNSVTHEPIKAKMFSADDKKCIRLIGDRLIRGYFSQKEHDLIEVSERR